MLNYFTPYFLRFMSADTLRPDVLLMSSSNQWEGTVLVKISLSCSVINRADR